jgi:hypothetical protein
MIFNDSWILGFPILRHKDWNTTRGHSTTAWTKFYPISTPSPLVWTFYMIPTLFHATKQTFYWPPPPSSNPRSYWMTPYLKKAFRNLVKQNYFFIKTWNISLNRCASRTIKKNLRAKIDVNSYFYFFYFHSRAWILTTQMTLVGNILDLYNWWEMDRFLFHDIFWQVGKHLQIMKQATINFATLLADIVCSKSKS